ncbi:TPA: hypothetical protein DIS56_00565 [Candidatus Saccharibacteria bacterium]|nr:MAG: hypothetical protein A3F05_01105 [Candidatus Saccharibacteria bacterium RIFCSPHIGHO2_12_FULL_47_17]HCM51617.1 hypothetical protein [Candidatus Saccharibacteria bacterium]
MRLLRKKLAKQYQTVSDTSRQQIERRPYIVPLLGLVLGFIIVAGILAGHKGITKPSDAHVVFLTDKGDRTVLDTKAATVGELLDKLNLNLLAEDVIEPSRETPIPEDNFRINIYRARPVTVIDSGNKMVTLTAQKSARVVAQKAGLSLQPEDVANFTPGSLAENIIGEKVVVSRATEVRLNLYGAALTTYTQAKNVGDLLKEKKIDLAEGETVQPSQATAITPNMEVFVLRKDAKLVNVEETIPVPEEIVNDGTLSFGTTVVRQSGAPGKKTVTYLIQADSAGNELARTAIHETVTTAAVPQITARGSAVAVTGDRTSLMAAASIASSDYNYVNYIVSRESSWRTNAAGSPPGAYGLCQAYPGSKMSTAGADWQTNPVTQLRWCSGYAQSRYGGWAGAYNFWSSNHYW